MFSFINYLRVIATVLITNSHYGTICPSSSMAIGGLLGNVLFFAASGFCLYKIKDGFGKWYVRRLAKILPIMILFTLFTVIIGIYPIRSWADFVRTFIYPSNYVFFLWICILYVPFYLVAYLSKKHDKALGISAIVVGVLWIIVYIAFIDKSAYVVDAAHGPFILFIYFSSMLLGAFMRKYMHKFAKIKWWNVLGTFLSLGAYFGSKYAFSRFTGILFLQIFNQFILLVALYFIFATFIGLEERLSKLNKKFNAVISFIAKLTLYIYLVQFVVIHYLDGLVFPLNFFVVTLGILACATALYFIEYYVKKGLSALVNKIKSKNGKQTPLESEDAESKN